MIDPNIPLMGRMPAPIDPLAGVAQAAQAMALRDQIKAHRQAAGT